MNYGYARVSTREQDLSGQVAELLAEGCARVSERRRAARAVIEPSLPRWGDRLTKSFSKKVENHAWSVALFTTYYNFVRIHRTLRMSPAMAAGVTDRLWEIGDIVALVEAMDIQPGKRGSYKKSEAEATS